MINSKWLYDFENLRNSRKEIEWPFWLGKLILFLLFLFFSLVLHNHHFLSPLFFFFFFICTFEWVIDIFNVLLSYILRIKLMKTLVFLLRNSKENMLNMKKKKRKKKYNYFKVLAWWIHRMSIHITTWSFLVN